jgi:dTDP-4-dehydrorhamnose reductase
MTILVTGSNGFVGSHVVKQLLKEGLKVIATSFSADASNFQLYRHYRFLQIDLTDASAIRACFESVKPNVVVHCAAMSKPDDCELRQADAYALNVAATAQLLLNAADYKSHFIHLSTDFIFNGKEGMHDENDTPDPLNYYGRTKLEAEEIVKKYEYHWTIVRTVFVYGETLYGRDSFCSFIARKLKNNESYKVVNDQERTPTYVGDLTKGIYEIIKRKTTGVFHLCGNETLTPYQMAVKTAKILGIAHEYLLTPVTCKEFTEIAKRPLKSGLRIEKAKQELGYEPINFDEGLKKSLEI